MNIKILLFLILFGLVKAHGRFIILAILGLTGLWMVHLLAQDYQKVTNPKTFISTIRKFVSKRSVQTNFNQNAFKFNLETVLYNDPIDCVKSFICQIAARKKLENEEKLILNYVRGFQASRNIEVIKQSLEIGKSAGDPSYCQRFYSRCPHNTQAMLNFIMLLSE